MGLFEYVAVLTSIIIGLGITHLLQGIARMIQRTRTERVYWVHLCWVAYVFVSLVFWWWWEYKLGELEVWTFEIYLFLIFYSVMMFLTAAVVLPETLEGFDGYRDYFYSRRAWIFGVLALLLVTDVVDSLAKGVDYWRALGLEYHVSSVVQPLLCMGAMRTRDARYHGAFAVFMLLHQLSWALRQYWTVS